MSSARLTLRDPVFSLRPAYPEPGCERLSRRWLDRGVHAKTSGILNNRLKGRYQHCAKWRTMQVMNIVDIEVIESCIPELMPAGVRRFIRQLSRSRPH